MHTPSNLERELAIQDRINQKHAVWSMRRLQLRYPRFLLTLFRDRYRHYHVLVASDVEDFKTLNKEFDEEVRPATCPVHLIYDMPKDMDQLEVAKDLAAELWLLDDPLTEEDANRLLCLSSPRIPEGHLRFDTTQRTWSFKSPEALEKDVEERVEQAFRRLEFPGEPSFAVGPMPIKPPSHVPDQAEVFRLVRSNQLGLLTPLLSRLVESDEETWRNFLNNRPSVVPSSHPAQEFSCLFDAADESDVQLSELLTIYDRVNLIPGKIGVKPLGRLKTNVAELAELAAMGRVRLVLPYSVHQYDPRLVEPVAEARSDAVVLSRSLAAQTITKVQAKDPMVYGPFTSEERAELLRVLMESTADERFRTLLGSYRRLYEGQHYTFMERGATACLGFGVGAHLGDVIQLANQRDVRVELMIAGAHVEWGLGLDASYVPVTLSRDFSLEAYSRMIASYLGRVRSLPADPATDRMHQIVDGLLAVSDVPALEVAKNLKGGAIARFRGLARRLMQDHPQSEELAQALAEVNRDVRAFEQRSKRLHDWGIAALIEEGARGGIHDGLHRWSVPVLWLLTMVHRKLPAGAKSELAAIAKTLEGLVLSPSADAVIVSRTRREIKGTS
jgi:hypothetical protein